MLGLHPVAQNQLLNLLKSRSETDILTLQRLLTESWRGGVPLLYSNLELLLSLRAKGASAQSELTTPERHLQQPGGKSSLTASATDMFVGKISRLSRRRRMARPMATLTETPLRTSSLAHACTSRPRAKSKQSAAKVADDCLEALTDFFDLMSYVDATLPAAAPLAPGPCTPEAFIWTGAELRDGLLDERSEEEDKDLSQELLLDMQAAVEGLGFRRCLCRVCDAWTDAQKYREELGDTRWTRLVERVTLGSTSKGQSFNFGFQSSLCSPSVYQRRQKLSRTVLSSKHFSLLGDRKAISVDYMPFLRCIGRFQRAQRQSEDPSRCVDYLSNKHLGLPKSTLHLLAEEFS
ncbi:uncharacterized protein V6R79_024853 [Siganus canaliculatus]